MTMTTNFTGRYQKLKKTQNWNIRSFIAALICVPIMVYIIGKSENFVPVVAFMDARTVAYKPTSVLLSIQGYKILDCEYVPNSQVGYVRRVGGKWKRVEFGYVGVDEDYTRPHGFFRTDFGLWSWQNDGIIKGRVDEVITIVQHSCGQNKSVEVLPDGTVEISGDLRFTTVGPFPARTATNNQGR